jgi:hypothetical protein
MLVGAAVVWASPASAFWGVHVGDNSCRDYNTSQGMWIDCDYNSTTDHPLNLTTYVAVDLATFSGNDRAELCSQTNDGWYIYCGPWVNAPNANGALAEIGFTQSSNLAPWIAPSRFTQYAWITVLLGPGPGGDSFQGFSVYTSK